MYYYTIRTLSEIQKFYIFYIKVIVFLLSDTFIYTKSYKSLNIISLNFQCDNTESCLNKASLLPGQPFSFLYSSDSG